MIEFTEEEKERHRARSRKKYVMDYTSDIATAEDRGRREGMEEATKKFEDEIADLKAEIARLKKN